MKYVDHSTWPLLRLPLTLIGVGAAITIGTEIWRWLSCCADGANTGTGMLWLLGLILLVGGGL